MVGWNKFKFDEKGELIEPYPDIDEPLLITDGYYVHTGVLSTKLEEGAWIDESKYVLKYGKYGDFEDDFTGLYWLRLPDPPGHILYWNNGKLKIAKEKEVIKYGK